jgi:phage terminase small subunit
MPLTDKKRLYAEARVAGKPKTAAAIAAGYSEATAPQAACRLEKDPIVAAAILRMTTCDRAESPPTTSVVHAEPVDDSGAFIPEPADDPLVFLKGVMNDSRADPKLRVEAAKSLASYLHAKPGDKGKKEERTDAARKVIGGKFATGAPPQLRAVK